MRKIGEIADFSAQLLFFDPVFSFPEKYLSTPLKFRLSKLFQ